MSIPAAIGGAVEAISDWLNPTKKEIRVLRRAVGAAEELLKILRQEDRYKDMPLVKRAEFERHYQRQFDSWKDGQT